jgi:hypothetical protein
MKRWVKFLDLFILFLVSLIFIIYIVTKYYESPSSVPGGCIDVNLAPSFSYESCYDAYSKTIFLGIKRSYDSYTLKDINISFFDFSNKNYLLRGFPNIGEGEIYKIPAEKNPKSIDIYLEISRKDFYNSICETPKKVFVEYCPEVTSLKGAEIIVNPLKNFDNRDFIEIEGYNQKKGDLFALSLVDKERIWMSECNSDWGCSSWGSCENDIQKRTCYDKNKCFIPISMPETSKYCGSGRCIESWQCQWSECVAGFTTPNCVDLNNCGTNYEVPQKIRCSNKDCIPDIECFAWSNCEIDYSLIDITSLRLNEIGGIKRRICRDKNYCADDIEEISQCSTSIDIYTKTFEKCGSEFIGIYNLLDNSLIARIERGTEINPYLNIILNEGNESLYCDYCFDGILNGDEEKIDCGGGCMPCQKKYL